jgi:uncharacterized YigZ family protein
MRDLPEYVSLAGPGTSELVVKRSRFIGSAAPAADPGEAEGFIAAVRANHPEASHNVFAYSVGLGNPHERLSDDGEPRGTAGYPILDTVHKRSLRNVVCVVTRYFGGTLLGAGGLLRAYGKAATDALDASGALRFVYHATVTIETTYEQLGRIQRELELLQCRILGIDYGEAVRFRAYVRVEQADAVSLRIRDLSAGRAEVQILEGEYLAQAEGS